MTLNRVLLILAGIVIAAGAAWLVAASLRDLGAAKTPEPSGAVKSGDAEGEAGERRWQDIARSGGPGEPGSRPIQYLEAAAANPFDGPFARARLEELALRLEGVAPGDRALALISGRVVRVGDVIDGFRVAHIDDYGISLEGPSGVRVELAPGMSTGPPDPPAEAEARRGRAGGETPRFLPGETRAAHQAIEASPISPELLRNRRQAAENRPVFDASTLHGESRRPPSREEDGGS